MTNQALPSESRNLLDSHQDKCQNLGLLLDKYAPWGETRSGWDLVMKETVRRRGQNQIQDVDGGQAKGLWLSTTRRTRQGETPSLFEEDRIDRELNEALKERWIAMIKRNDGLAFRMTLSERLVAGLGASHVLETGLTLARNTGLPYLPGSSVKGLARAWGLIEVAAQLGIHLTDETRGDLNQLATELIEEAPEDLLSLYPDASNDAIALMQWFRLIFGSQHNGGAVAFLDGIYYGNGDQQALYVTDVMTPHYVQYYTEDGGRPPADDDNPNPISFLTVESGNRFAFGLLPRRGAFSNPDDIATALEVAADWLGKGLSQLGAGGKTAAGYGFFSRKSMKLIDLGGR